MSSDDEPIFDERSGFWGEDGQWYERRDVCHSKEDQIYGVFLDKPRHKKYPRATRKHNVQNGSSSLHFNFVQGGIITANEGEEQHEEKKECMSVNNSDCTPGSILKEWESIKQQQRDLHTARNGPQLGTNGLPQQLGKKKEKTRKRNAVHEGINIGIKKDKGYAKWTKNEKRNKFGGLSFAERYLKKHGFKGRLGSMAQGIANPIKQAAARKNNEGLGFNGMDNKQQQQPKDLNQKLKEIQKKTVLEKDRLKQKRKMWKIIDEHHINTQQPNKKRKINYHTASEFYVNQNDDDYNIDNNDNNDSEIIDNNNNVNDICPAFRFNVNRICDLMEERKEILHREAENLKQKKHTLKLQLDRLTKQKSIHDTRNRKLYELKALINRLKNEISINEMHDIFSNIQNKFYGEYLRYRLWRLFVHVLFPRIKQEVELQNVSEILIKWKALLSSKDKEDIYHLLIENVIIPKIRHALYEWDPLHLDNNRTFVELFKTLRDVFPIKSYRQILSQLIIPRLNYILLDINMMDIDDSTASCIILWHFVFLNPIDDILNKTVTKKMKQFWRKSILHQNNLYYINTLKRWKSVLNHIKIYDYIMEKIVMKQLSEILSECIHAIDINHVKTTAEYVEQRINTVNEWYLNDMLNVYHYIQLLQDSFFDTWLLLIYQRLNDSVSNGDININQIQFIWNNLFAVIKNNLFNLQDEKINDWIQKYLNCALDMIYFVICHENETLPSFDKIKNIFMESNKTKEKKKKKKSKQRDRNLNDKQWTDEYKDINRAQLESVSMLEWIQITAENHGIEFCLNPNLVHDGKKVYKLGSLLICLYDKSIFLKKGNEWNPVNLQDLLFKL